MTPAAVVLAHQGGWDETLLVLAPVSLFGLLLWLANRRANAQVASRDDEDLSEDMPEDTTDADPPEE